MALTISADEIDWRAYEKQTDPAVKVRKASAFASDLVSEFALREGEDTTPTMTSTRLRGLLHFRVGETTAWAGYNGHRKSMFVGQVAMDMCASGQRVLIASMEMQPARTLARMARQAAGVRYPAPAWLNGFARWTDGRLWLFDHMGRITPTMCLAVCRYFADELKGQHVVIDSMMMVCASEEHLDEQKQFTTDLVRLAKETGLHIHLVAHCRKPLDDSKPPNKWDLRGSAAISDQCENVVTIWANKPKAVALEKDPNDNEALAKPDALVGVEKQRNGEWEGKVKLWFHSPSLRFLDDRITSVQPFEIDGDAA